MNPGNSLFNIIIPEFLSTRFLSRKFTLLFILLLVHGFVYAQNPRQRFLELRKAAIINKANNKANPLFQTNTKINSRVLRPNQTLCDFTLDSVHVTNNPLSQIVQSLAGSGITISNIQTNLPASSSMYGSFSCGSGAKLGLDSGLVLTSGSIFSAKGPNSESGKTGENSPLPGYSLLDDIASDAGFDAVWVSFDIVSITDSIKFDYVFASEEYKEFVFSEFNDVFGFFISGPGITGTQNLAVLPNSTTPVTINSINHLVNPQYYIDNDFNEYLINGGQIPPGIDATRFNNFEFDGLTTVLTARAHVVPGQTYHLILAIEDVADDILDSGVFLKEGSVTSGVCPMNLSATHTDLPCPAANNGSINLTITNGKAPFNIKWSNNATTEDLNNLAAGTYTVTVTDATPCQKKLAVTVSAGASTFVPSVLIAANPGNTICAGTNVIFTATPVNGGTTPAYQWKLNGANVGTNSNTYQSAALANGNKVTCVMTSSLACTNPVTATSNEITMAVTPVVVPSVSIAANPGNTICAGSSVTFTATPVNGGPTPAYQWKLNGANVGTNINTYQSAALANGNKITCVMTSALACANPTTATSNEITMAVTPAVVPSVIIAANPGNTICTGTSVTFTATPTNGGSTPAYQWKLNGANVGTNSNTYQSAALANGNKITCVMTSALACANPATATSNEITMAVTPAVVPSVLIAANPGNTICTGTSVTFTATPTNGGSTPAYQWKLNGANVGTNINTYQSAALANGNKITCIMTSALACANPATATSNEITMAVTAAVVPSVSIAANPGNTICTGTSVTFTATPTNGGATPAYQWKLNGANVGTNINTYQSAALANGNKITCVMVSALACANPTTATSNEITMAVTPAVVPSVLIAANPGNTICTGTSVTFTATPTNGGSTPAYQWKLNGANVGTNINTYQSAALANGNKITCVMTSSLACANPTTATSNEITMAVTASVVPSVLIVANPGNTICAGTSVTFTATPTNGGATPAYQWKLNGANVGTNINTYQSAALANGNKITCVMTSALACANPATATSNEITMAVTAAVAPSVLIAANPGTTICAGTSVTFTATPTNGGATPAYQWKLNGANVGTNINTYQSAALANGNKITCVMTSALACANPTTATSNEITMAVTPAVVPSVIIAANPGNTICTGTSVTFTATPTNGGSTPAYQWKLNGANVGTNINTYQSAALANGNKITCVMTSALACANPATATSNEITMAVTSTVAPSVLIAANPGNTICAGTSVTFTATPTNGGATPAYQWKLNGANVGTNINTYQSAALANGNKITCVMTSALACANPATATSNEITMAVTAAVVPSVLIAANPGNTICAGTSVTFTATPTNGGATPAYQWKLNGANVGTNINTYQSAALANGNKITCVMTSALACANPATATSNEITMAVTPAVVPSVIIAANPGNTNCTGTSVTFTATPTNGGSTPAYQWKLNGANVGTNSNTYQSAALANGNKITCVMTSALACANPTTATSNEITMSVTALLTFYRDLDGDGYGNANSGTTQACTAPAGYVINNTDCNDNNLSVNPAALEICENAVDDNCNGQIDENCIITVSSEIILRPFFENEGNNKERLVDFKISISQAPKKTGSVRYTTESGTASPGKDYKPADGIIQFAPGIKEATIKLTILGDLVTEGPEMFYIRFSDPVNVTLPSVKKTWVIIIDDDMKKGKLGAIPIKGAKQQITDGKNFDDLEITVPSLLYRNQALVVKGVSNAQTSIQITDIRGVTVAQLNKYANNWIPGNVTPGIYFYQLIYRNQKGELQRKTGKIFITD